CFLAEVSPFITILLLLQLVQMSFGAIRTPNISKNKNLSVSHLLTLPMAYMALERSNIKYTAYLDSDGLALPSKLKRQVDFLEVHPDIDFMHAKTSFIYQDGQDANNSQTARYFSSFWHEFGKTLYDVATPALLQKLSCPVNNQTVMMRMGTHVKAGFQNPLWGPGQDMMYWASVVHTGATFGFLNELLGVYRVRQ
ncbi:glycosyltransferase family 2 protein, partial [Candidatus Woesearchaeota archaeon]|nr:glycosyltransferase family 2 protein [Candidatus Woesearchaeota archaeon]